MWSHVVVGPLCSFHYWFITTRKHAPCTIHHTWKSYWIALLYCASAWSFLISLCSISFTNGCEMLSLYYNSALQQLQGGEQKKEWSREEGECFGTTSHSELGLLDIVTLLPTLLYFIYCLAHYHRPCRSLQSVSSRCISQCVRDMWGRQL